MTTVRETLVAEYGEGFARSINHVADVVNTYRTDGEDVLIFNLARSGDVHGYDNAVEVSNYRDLISRWSDFDVLTGTYTNVDTIGLRLDSPAPADLTEVIDALADYPVLDEDLMSQVETEIIDEHWESYGERDTLTTVAKAIDAALPDDRDVSVSDLTSNAEDIVRRLVWSGFIEYGHGGGYPYLIDESAVDFGATEVAEWIVERLDTVATVNRWGDETESFDLTLDNLLVPVSVSA